jgi:hypothetical protein
MNRHAACSSVLLFLLACSGGESRPLAADCRPAVSVIISDARKAPHKAGAAPRREVAQVYWDVSSSMREFTVARRGRGTKAAEADDLAPVVAALDSSVLLRAHAEAVEQYGVGESITQLPSARSALHPFARRTVLHRAAEQIGTALAEGSAQAALVVSDMELDTPPRNGASQATVCGGVPLPSTPLAGALFGRCFEHAVLSSDTPAPIRTHLLVHVFRKSSHGRELFILLLATDHAFGRRIADEIASRLDFAQQVIFDSESVAAANVRGCGMTAPAPDVRLREPGCGAKCFEPDAVIQVQCDLRRPAKAAWIEPAGRGKDGVTYETQKERAIVRFAIPCTTPPGRFNARVSFTWRAKAPDATFAAQPSVRDLFDSLSDAIVRVVSPRTVRIGIDLAK